MDELKTPLFTTSILSSGPFVFIGLISYSLYLWHWPLVGFSNYWALDPLPTSVRLGILVLSVLLPVLSWRFVETPFRQKKICHSRTGILQQTRRLEWNRRKRFGFRADYGECGGPCD
jgi:peptidoglycan/LPS O-acetylase OafA/YrhL